MGMKAALNGGEPERDVGSLTTLLDLWRLFAGGVPDILLLVNRAGTILFINRTPVGIDEDAMLNTNIFDFVPADRRSELRSSLEDVFAAGMAHSGDLPVTLPDGAVRWYATHAGPLYQEGAVVAATIVARDVTDQKHAESALRESEERYRTLVEHAPEAIVVLDVDECRFVDVNRNACALFGMRQEALMQADLLQLSPPTQPDGRASRDAVWERIHEALAGGVPTFEWTHRTQSGADLRCEVRLVRLPARGRRLIRGSITDVTRQRHLEEHVQQWQKLETLGQLAGGIAHDFNNILTVISGAAQMLSHTLPPNSEQVQDVEDIRGAARQGAALTRQLIGFARLQKGDHEVLDLNGIVDHVLVMLGRLLAHRVTLVRVLDPTGAPVRGVRSQLEQVLMNLLLNARDAMPDGGAVTIRTIRDRSHPGQGVVHLQVEDTGIGMDDATRRRLFEPFFTTKEPGKGSGLGLSTVAAIVRQGGGRVEVTSRLGAGTTFDVILPEACPGTL